MSKSDGITRSRWKVGSHNGFSIIKVLAVHHWYNNYDHRYEMSRQYETKREVYYEFCNEGDENRPAQAYTPYPYVRKEEEIKECIDKFIKDDSIYFTDAERQKYVYGPNHKCEWAYGYNSLMKILREHQKATKRMKILIEDRLTDANFHTECSFLSDGDYEGFKKFVTEHFQFREKFEIITSTECKRIKDPKQFEEGLAKVVEEYLASQGVKGTSASVRFIEVW